MPRTKFVIMSAAGAAVLAFVSALFGRVSFGAILLRSIFWAGVFGIFGFGSHVLLSKIIPELFEISADHEVDTEAGETYGQEKKAEVGGNLNIVLEGEEPAFSAAEEDASEEDLPGRDENEFIEEIQSVDEEDGEAYLGSEKIEAQPADDEDARGGGRGGGGALDVDSLPDLEDFSESFDSVAAAQEGDDQFIEQPGEEVDLLGTHHDPATIAKAVRTIIGRDQEG
jgi:hypothetical protein